MKNTLKNNYYLCKLCRKLFPRDFFPTDGEISHREVLIEASAATCIHRCNDSQSGIAELVGVIDID